MLPIQDFLKQYYTKVHLHVLFDVHVMFPLADMASITIEFLVPVIPKYIDINSTLSSG